MYHLRLKGDHYQMGVKRGTLFRKNGVTFPLHLDRFQLDYGTQSERILNRFFPEVCQEIRGVSDAAGVDYTAFASWLLCMGCCMYNLEENIPVEVRGCTAFACVKNGRVIYGRNNDLPPYLKKGSKSELYAPAGGNRFVITTSSFINGEEGLNEHGLAVAMTFVMTRLEDIRPGLNSCFLVRYLLEKADSVKTALTLLKEVPAASNCNLLLADASGEMLVAECTPSEKRVREAERLDGGRIVCAVNRFTSPEMRPYDGTTGNDYRSEERYRTVMEHFAGHIQGLERKEDGDLIGAAKQLLKGEFGFLCQYDDEPDFETVWSPVFDLKSRMIYRGEGDPRRCRFVEDRRLRDCMERT